ncbi:hypothetical protein ICE98_01418 [Lactococcus lactis]|nr:hypothetical protein [Lactococcus lactis]
MVINYFDSYFWSACLGKNTGKYYYKYQYFCRECTWFGNNSLGSLYNQNVGNTVANTANHVFGQMIFPIIISFIILHAATILGGWLANFAILGDKTFTFKKMLNYYGRFYVLLFALNFVSFLFAPLVSML